jgi:sensor histidine kinase regulating citrate/malate metabolism
MYIAVPVTREGRVIGFARVALPVDQVQSRLAVLIRTILVGSLIAVGLAILIASAVAEYTSRPIRQPTDAVHALILDDQSLNLSSSQRTRLGNCRMLSTPWGANYRSNMMNSKPNAPS